jgi:hypothetical protein
VRDVLAAVTEKLFDSLLNAAAASLLLILLLLSGA